ncbi:MAG: DUF1015 domain-containing protein [Promicromonosporaceae bacterium]|nr:DUF1015 domain-containing protein [Promicromonosporaceae bacterium]
MSQPEVLIPNVPDLTKWAVIACDQFTGEPEYWENLTEFVGDAPSSLRFVLPEAWLEQRLASAPPQIAAEMERAQSEGWFDTHQGYVLVERMLPSGVRRLGLMADIDLDAYDYTDSGTAAIRATEKTVAERLPARVAVRQAGTLDVPHVLVLLDDPKSRVIESLYEKRESFDQLYDFDLNQNGGHLRGWLLPDDDGAITRQLESLTKDGLFAVVGDGNHSLAAAKLSGDSQALVELTNIHDEANYFEPIHRIVFDGGPELADELIAFLRGRVGRDGSQTDLYHDGETTAVPIPANPADAIADIQQFLDEYLVSRPDTEIDYIHGDDNLRNIADRARATGRDALGIFLPRIDKSGLFDYVVRRGVLPRKAFSIGHAEDKRYYLELAHRK